MNEENIAIIAEELRGLRQLFALYIQNQILRDICAPVDAEETLKQVQAIDQATEAMWRR